MQNKDNLVICKRCGSDACFEQVVTPEVTNYQCFGCGFITNTILTNGSKFFNEQIAILPDLYKELMGEDEDGLIWMPTTINVPSQGMVFANGKNGDNWKWAAVKAIEVTEEEKERYPIPSKPGEFYEWRMAMETMQEFEEHLFMDALSYIGALPEDPVEEDTEVVGEAK